MLPAMHDRPTLLKILIVLSQALTLDCLAQAIEMPAVKSGDTWTYRVTVEKGTSGWTQVQDELTVSRVTSTTIYYASRQKGSTQAASDQIAGLDWRRLRNVNGTESVVSQPLSFPLVPGKSWDIDYTGQKPNKAHRFEHWQSSFKVVGYETVEVAAGTFHALKIEAEGHWTAEPEPSQTVVQGAQTAESGTTMVTEVKKTSAGPVTGRTYKAIWYAPEVKRWVKSIEEYYGSGGARSERYSAELESFKVAD